MPIECILLKRKHFVKRARPHSNSAAIGIPKKYLGKKILAIVLEDDDEFDKDLQL